MRRLRLSHGILLSMSLVPGARGLMGGEGDFLRGDVNGDGIVSVADVHRLLGFLYHGFTPPECMRSADIDDSGVLDYDDARNLWNFFRLDYPFPAPGTGELDCLAHGGGSPLEDAAARVRVLDFSATDGFVSLKIAISSTGPAAGFSGTLRIPGTEIRSIVSYRDVIVTEESDENGNPWRDATAHFYTGVTLGTIDFMLIRSATVPVEEVEWIPPGDDVVVFEINGCIVPGTAAGEYPITLEAAEIIDAESGRAIQPELEHGLLTLENPVRGDCETGLRAVFTIGGASAPPGGSAALPFTVSANEVLEGYSFSVDFDEEVLQGEDVEVVWERPDGLDYDFQFSEINNDNVTPGSHGVDEGYIIGASVFSMDAPFFVMPANTDVVALRFHFTVEPGTSAGSTEVAFIDGGRKQGGDEWINVATAGGTGIGLSGRSAFFIVNGAIAIIDDIATFIRGDANGDQAVDMSDPITTLNFLFLGSGRPSCYDAADFDDNGRIDISDPLATLGHLFNDGRAPPPPFVTEGEDPTPDAMTCLTR